MNDKEGDGIGEVKPSDIATPKNITDFLVYNKSEKTNSQSPLNQYSKAKLSRAYAMEDLDWSHLLDPKRQIVKGPMIDVLEPGLFVGIPSKHQDYSLGYSSDMSDSPRVPIRK
ncbi:hypothetical protein F0562_034337 [Nyssa sinensis]|uniref:Uncharacterized protein n=1 Tax=Nyssa sinensis TaxID=561372 RepID=A0A5J5AJC5_9ASTE|nr:hypothetical protein F0562_034337 [Nyssa sinensis]